MIIGGAGDPLAYNDEDRSAAAETWAIAQSGLLIQESPRATPSGARAYNSARNRRLQFRAAVGFWCKRRQGALLPGDRIWHR